MTEEWYSLGTQHERVIGSRQGSWTWLVVPKTYGSTEQVIGIAKNGSQEWSITTDFVTHTRPRTDLTTTADLMTFLDQ